MVRNPEEDEEEAMQGEEVEGVPLFMASPSFRGEAPAAPPPEDPAADDSDKESDFEFAFVVQDPEIGPGISADEIFSNGRMRTVYPVFNRALLFADGGGCGDGCDGPLASASAPAEEEKTEMVRGTLRRLLMEDRRENRGSASSSSSSSSAAMDELDGISPATYCVWTPNPSASPSRCRKSRSTGSSLRWRLRDLVIGRSHSDGKEKFVLLAADAKSKPKTNAKGNESTRREATPASEKPVEHAGSKAKTPTAVDVVTAHRIYYSKAAAVAARRSFLPYRRDLVGLFASVNGIARTHHPF